MRRSGGSSIIVALNEKPLAEGHVSGGLLHEHVALKTLLSAEHGVAGLRGIRDHGRNPEPRQFPLKQSTEGFVVLKTRKPPTHGGGSESGYDNGSFH